MRTMRYSVSKQTLINDPLTSLPPSSHPAYLHNVSSAEIYHQTDGNDEMSCHCNSSSAKTAIKLTDRKKTITLLHPFNSLFCRTTWVSWHQKGKPFWILLEQEMMGWQWHLLDHMQIICTLLQTDNHASTSPLSFCRPDALPAAQPTASKH